MNEGAKHIVATSLSVAYSSIQIRIHLSGLNLDSFKPFIQTHVTGSELKSLVLVFHVSSYAQSMLWTGLTAEFLPGGGQIQGTEKRGEGSSIVIM